MTRRVSSLLHDPPLPGTGRLSILSAGSYVAGVVAGLDGLASSPPCFVRISSWLRRPPLVDDS